MDYKNWSNGRFWLIIFGVLIFGMMIAPKNPTKEIIKEVPATCNYSNWKALKEIDDRGFSLSASSAVSCSDGFNALLDQDVDAMNKVIDKMKVLVPQIEKITTERQEILKKLGY
jgi:hypothetical protein